MQLTLHKPKAIKSTTILLPGSKSISNRVLIIKALSGLSFSIQNISTSDDTINLQKALTNSFSVIDVGHAGTDMRFLTAFFSIHKGTVELTGSERLKERPIKDLVNALRELGADIEYKNTDGFPPLLIAGKNLDGGKVSINGNVSSQFISSLLLVAPYFKNGLELIITNEVVSKPYIKMTIDLMRDFGASIIEKNNTIIVNPVPYSYHQNSYFVESDWSAASYYYSLVALSPIHTNIVLSGLVKNSLQPDAVCELIYENFGVETIYLDGKVSISKKQFQTISVLHYNFINCPDIAQTVVCTCIGLKVPFKINGLQTLKLKETDRIIALKNELSKFNIHLEATPVSLACIDFKQQNSISCIEINTYNDHRMAMSFAPLVLKFNQLVINSPSVVSKSYPLFWEHLIQLGINSI